MRYAFVFDTDGILPVRVFDAVAQQVVIQLPVDVANKTMLIYQTAASRRGQTIADEWMHGYVSGSVDTELIMKGLV